MSFTQYSINKFLRICRCFRVYFVSNAIGKMQSFDCLNNHQLFQINIKQDFISFEDFESKSLYSLCFSSQNDLVQFYLQFSQINYIFTLYVNFETIITKDFEEDSKHTLVDAFSFRIDDGHFEFDCLS